MFAVVDCAGKQYKVVKDRFIFVDKLDKNVGDVIELKALLVFDGKELKTSGVVKAEVLAQVLDDKIVVFHYKAKKQIRKKQGHRQPMTKIKIVEIA